MDGEEKDVDLEGSEVEKDLESDSGNTDHEGSVTGGATGMEKEEKDSDSDKDKDKDKDSKDKGMPEVKAESPPNSPPDEVVVNPAMHPVYPPRMDQATQGAASRNKEHSLERPPGKGMGHSAYLPPGPSGNALFGMPPTKPPTDPGWAKAELDRSWNLAHRHGDPGKVYSTPNTTRVPARDAPPGRYAPPRQGPPHPPPRQRSTFEENMQEVTELRFQQCTVQISKTRRC